MEELYLVNLEVISIWDRGVGVLIVETNLVNVFQLSVLLGTFFSFIFSKNS